MCFSAFSRVHADLIVIVVYDDYDVAKVNSISDVERDC